MGEATLRAIWIKRAHGGPMDPAAEADLVAGRGIVGNADQGRRRQVTIIDEDVWAEVMRRLGASLDPKARRANLMVRGVGLANSRGRVLRVGACRVRIFGETRPCNNMDEALPGLRAALADGCIRVGDPVAWEDDHG